jgi:hypothetical protein
MKTGLAAGMFNLKAWKLNHSEYRRGRNAAIMSTINVGVRKSQESAVSVNRFLPNFHTLLLTGIRGGAIAVAIALTA